MTQLLQQALEEIQKLPNSQQDATASLILDELADEKLWERGDMHFGLGCPHNREDCIGRTRSV